jgi:magnesium chelatase subunit I
MEVVRQRDEFERDPEAFVKRQSRKQGRLRKQIERARAGVDQVEVPPEMLEAAAELCMALGTDGLRGELTLVRAARALAALAGRDSVALADLRAMAPSVLRHRLRRDPLDESGSSARIEKALVALFD